MAQLASSNESLQQRTYPPLAGQHLATRPISFVTVHFCGDLPHNLLVSECVRDSANQLIIVDNRHNLLHDTLGMALEFGISQARHDLIALVHEDVLLLPGWQPALERALTALERHDPQWAFAGAAGWLADGTMRGHWSDPHGYFDRLQGAPFAEVDRIDEQLVLVRRSQRIPLDATLPSIHNIGSDLARTARAHGRRTYVVDAPTIHKFADANGHRILCKADSPKIVARTSLTYLADQACSDLYFGRKWSLPTGVIPPQAGGTEGSVPAGNQDADRLASPIILLAKGGGGSRLLSVLAQDAGVFLGNRVNASGDSLEMAQATYGAVLSKYRYQAAHLLSTFVHRLRRGAESMLAGSNAGFWGYKLPESLLILDEIEHAFPAARFVHLVRDPLHTCLRRTHMTARYDNQVGQASLLAAYRVAGRDLRCLIDDSAAVRMAITTLHQIGTTLDWTRKLPPQRLLEIRFEDALRDPGSVLKQMRQWLHGVQGADGDPGTHAAPQIFAAIDHKRAANPGVVYPPEVETEVAELLAPLRRRLHYLADN